MWGRKKKKNDRVKRRRKGLSETEKSGRARGSIKRKSEGRKGEKWMRWRKKNRRRRIERNGME